MNFQIFHYQLPQIIYLKRLEDIIDLTNDEEVKILEEELKQDIFETDLWLSASTRTSFNQENYLILKDLSDEDKRVNIKQAVMVFKDLLKGEQKSYEGPKAIVVQESNPILNPERTIFYRLITGHMTEFDNIKINEELSEEEKFEETNQLLRHKIGHFLNNMEKVYKTSNIRLLSCIEGAKKIYNECVNNDRDWIEQFICNLWINENLALYEVGNAAILTDFYYVVMGKKFEPRFYQQANFSKEFKGLREKIEILTYFGGGLCFMGLHYGGKREAEVEVFRANHMGNIDNYIVGKSYRFITFQSCSVNMNVAAGYLVEYDSEFYTINIPSNGKNALRLKKEGSNKSDEYLIMPYTSFTLDKIPDKFKYIDEGILDEEKEERVREAKQYEVTLNKQQFYADKVKARWWKRF